jgi:hypothetical protein
MPSLKASSTVAIHLIKGGEQQVVTVPLRRMELDGTLVLALRHPVGLQIGRQLTISIPTDGDWQTQRVRVEAPRFKPHDDAGLLRLVVVPWSAATSDLDEPDAPPDPPAETAVAGPAPAEPSSSLKPPAGPAAAGPVRAELRKWQGRHPAGSVALQLKSGRVRTMTSRHIDDEGALVLTTRRATTLSDGDEVKLAWSERQGWLTASTVVAPVRPEGHPDAGLLRLELQGAPQEQRERRSGERRPMKLGLRGTIERGAPLVKGTRFEWSTIDVSVGGAAFITDVDLAPGDRVKLRLIGPSGQLPGGEFGAEVLRVHPLPEGTERKIVLIWRDPPSEFRKALQRLIEADR